MSFTPREGDSPRPTLHTRPRLLMRLAPFMQARPDPGGDGFRPIDSRQIARKCNFTDIENCSHGACRYFTALSTLNAEGYIISLLGKPLR